MYWYSFVLLVAAAAAATTTTTPPPPPPPAAAAAAAAAATTVGYGVGCKAHAIAEGVCAQHGNIYYMCMDSGVDLFIR